MGHRLLPFSVLSTVYSRLLTQSKHGPSLLSKIREEEALATQQPFHARTVQTLATSVQREIERRIMTGELTAGERLSEVALAQSLGVSRGPVREAMRSLAAAGLVELNANRSVVVRRLGIDDALDLYDLRGVIFGLACEHAAERANKGDLERLATILDDCEQAAEAGDNEAYYRLNLAFHEALLETSRSQRLQAIYAGAVKETHLFRRRGLAIAHNMTASCVEHRAILDALSARDRSAAFAVGRAHVAGGRERFRQSLGERMETAPA